MWAAFHDSRFAGVLGVRSMWPSMVLPKVLLAQLLQVRFRSAGNARPSAVEPVIASCWFGCMPPPLTMAPFSVSAVSRVILLFALWRDAQQRHTCFNHRPAGPSVSQRQRQGGQ